MRVIQLIGLLKDEDPNANVFLSRTHSPYECSIAGIAAREDERHIAFRGPSEDLCSEPSGGDIFIVEGDPANSAMLIPAEAPGCKAPIILVRDEPADRPSAESGEGPVTRADIIARYSRRKRRANVDSIIGVVAYEKLGLETLSPHGWDRLDFYNLPVWRLRDALAAAYEAGADSVRQATAAQGATTGQERVDQESTLNDNAL